MGEFSFIDPCDVAVVQAEGNYVLLQQRERLVSAAGIDLDDCGEAEALRLCSYPSVRAGECFFRSGDPAMHHRRIRASIEGRKEYTVTRTYKKNLKSLADSGSEREASLLIKPADEKWRRSSRHE